MIQNQSKPKKNNRGLKMNKNAKFSEEQLDQLHHLLEEQIARISVEEEEEQIREEITSKNQK